ncbi:hypothetical protein F5887DRAFT_1273589 [Amanita rubescens]|nr:hypothetical protein F5887DRAFT_1273589 [Amanita rubescens]
MTIPSVQTTTHTYPQAELDAMTNFYGGKRCVISLMRTWVEWSHTLDAALESSDERLSQMFMRKLRQDRHPRHAAEVQENIVPRQVNIHHHRSVDEQPPGATLFLHEDILARTLAYEQDLHQWRITELEAGRGDPGRPTYEEASGRLHSFGCHASPVLQVFGGTQPTQHRLHTADSFEPFVRNEGGPVRPVYEHHDCPGIDDPTSQRPFPIIDTLLSIPFSLLHNLPRLVAIVPISVYQQQLITMGSEIVRLWWWDPPPDLIEKSEKIRLQKNAQNQHDGTRSAKPYPIHHQSRNGTTFLTKQPIITYGTPSTHSSNQDARTFELPSGQILLGTIPSLFWDGDGLLLTPGHEGLAEMVDVQHADKGINTGAMSSPVASEAWDVQTIEGTDSTSDDIDGMEDVEEKPSTGPSSSEILSWYEQVAESAPEPLPLIPGSFERGVIGGMSTNDVLMIKGLIDPPVYIQFLDLSSVSKFFDRDSKRTL